LEQDVSEKEKPSCADCWVRDPILAALLFPLSHTKDERSAGLLSHLRRNTHNVTIVKITDFIYRASGSASDRRHAMAAFARAYSSDPVDVIISDYMSEANMVVAAARKIDSSPNTSPDANPLVAAGPAFEASFLEALEPALPDLAKHGIRVAVNAGASDTEGLYKVVRDMIHKKGLASKLKLAWIAGDEVLPTVKSSLKSGNSTFKNIYTGEILSSWKFDPIYAQAYLGGLGIAEAFTQGAQIVICGRVSDASPVIGAAYWFHQWRRDQLDELANAFVAGHRKYPASFMMQS
jgi:hypothetical protein